jgi:sulfite reductase (ferredoxin)
VLKADLKPSIAAINETLLTTLAACGDVARNVMTTPAPIADAVHQRLDRDAHMLSAALLPKTRAYHEIFLDDEPVGSDEEPLYGDTYLPRKFKVGLATPSDNTVDVLSNDLGLIALFEGEELVGYNIAVGGGLGMTHNRADTYPRLASVVGFVGPDDLWNAVRAVVELQRDNGDRTDRKRARLKYVVDGKGLDWVRETLVGTYGLNLEPARPMPKFQLPDHLGWHEQGDGRWWLGVPVASGRIADFEGAALRSALRAVMQQVGADPIMTAQQDVLLSNIPADRRADVEAILSAHGVKLAETMTPFERWTLACPALPTCGLALTEAERVRQPIVASIQSALDGLGLGRERISLRITGCPNGCARSYAGDIGLVGRVPGRYALYVGGDFEGTVLSERIADKVLEADIAATLQPLLAGWSRDRAAGEGFGDWCRRTGVPALQAMLPSAAKAA